MGSHPSQPTTLLRMGHPASVEVTTLTQCEKCRLDLRLFRLRDCKPFRNWLLQLNDLSILVNSGEPIRRTQIVVIK